MLNGVVSLGGQRGVYSIICELEILFQFTFAPAFLTAVPMIPLNIGINFADIYLLYMIYHV